MSAIARNAKAIFLEAVENHPPEQWPAFLEEKCSTDRELRQRVEGLLQAHQEKDDLFDRADPTAEYRPLEQPGQMIGPYKLRERLGEGGMGVVWAAEQKQPLHRKVALKVIKPGMDSEQVIARFEAEREALALMEHPNIARVLDAGTTDQGRPYFVMELIHGIPITTYCDSHRMGIAERLQLFTLVCEAVRHAHQKGIIHRDIKPPNVLVTEQDGRPIPKVIDFGVAKALHRSLTDRSIYTSVFQVIGTLAYMSPEQAALSAVDIDTRADVYGLGAMLYELLSGTTPIDRNELESAALDEAFRMVRELDPLKPSSRLSALGKAETDVSRSRGTESHQLNRLVRGDLDWIVMKALDKDRTRRYGSANDLLSDVQRYLQNEPIAARPPSWWYRTSKYVRRHRVPVTSSAIVLLIVVSLGVALIHSLLRKKELLESIRIELQDKAIAEALQGREEATDYAIHAGREAGASESWGKMVHGIQLIYSGQCNAAVSALLIARDETPPDHPDYAAICSALATSYMYAGMTEECLRTMFEITHLEPRTREGALLMAQVLLITDVDEKSDERTNDLIARYFENQFDSPVGRLVRAMKRSIQAARIKDPELAEQACVDSLIAREQMPLSPIAWEVAQMAHSLAHSVYLVKGERLKAESHLETAIMLSDGLLRDSVRGFASAHFNAASFLEGIGDIERARRHWKVAYKSGLCGFHQAGYAQFVYRHDGMASAKRVLGYGKLSDTWLRIVRATLMLDQREDREFAVAELSDMAKNGCIDSILVIGLLAAAGEPLSRDDVRIGKSPVENSFRSLEFQETAENLFLPTTKETDIDTVLQVPGCDRSTAGLFVALKMIADREPASKTIAQLQQLFESDKVQFSVYRTFCETLMAILQRNPHWPQCDEDPQTHG